MCRVQPTVRARGATSFCSSSIATSVSMKATCTFCDMGIAQFWIRPEDLAAGRFEYAWGTTEGG
ncbi:MAG: DUF1963 domain-containing protein [Hyphomicrobiaceae bacterium]